MQKGTAPLLSVVIVTRNRAASLQKAVISLLQQSSLPDEILVINNDSRDQTEFAIKNLQKITKIPLRSIVEQKIGYPFVYNSGLEKAQYSWVAFIDDDCVAHPNWVSELKKTLQKNEKVTVLLGESKTTTPQNIFSLATFILDQNWKLNNISGSTVLDYEILDNKNIVYNNTFLKKHHLKFDETRANILGGAAEDCDLGRQIEHVNGVALYVPTAICSHQDPTNLKWYWKRNLKSFAAYLVFRQKWPAEPEIARHIRLGYLISQNRKKYKLSFFQYLNVTCLLSLTVAISLVLSKLLKSKTIESAFITFSENL